MKKIFYLILMSLTFFVRLATAQMVQVLDSVKNAPIEYATIIVLNAAKDTILQQGRTDLKGRYQINIRNTNLAFISVTTVGYKKNLFLISKCPLIS